jgi:hypothetical protein
VLLMGPLWFMRVGRRLGVQMVGFEGVVEEEEEVGRRASIAIIVARGYWRADWEDGDGWALGAFWRAVRG